MRRPLATTLLTSSIVIPLLLSQVVPHGYAQTGGPVGDDFNNSAFTAPFAPHCGTVAAQPCPDTQGPNTWSLNTERPGFLRIVTQPGSLVGSTQSVSNNARNFVVQPVNAGADYTITTSLLFPGVPSSITPVGQAAGLLIYQGDDDFISLSRTYVAGVGPQIQFIQETSTGGTVNDLISTAPDTALQSTVYLRITKTGSQYSASYSYDNVNFTPVNLNPTLTPTATATSTATATPTLTLTSTATATPTQTPGPVNAAYTAVYGNPQVGVFAWGGTALPSAAQELIADFDWFRVGNSQIAAPSPTATATGTATSTGTATATATATSTATATATGTATATSVAPTATSTATATATATATSTPVPPTPTNTAVPTPTPKPKPAGVNFKYVSVWYHVIHRGDVQHIEAKGSQNRAYGLWVHVYFANGRHLDYYVETDGNGFWQTNFTIPHDAITKFGGNAVVTFQLWRGKSTVQRFETFTVI